MHTKGNWFLSADTKILLNSFLSNLFLYFSKTSFISEEYLSIMSSSFNAL